MAESKETKESHRIQITIAVIGASSSRPGGYYRVSHLSCGMGAAPALRPILDQ